MKWSYLLTAGAFVGVFSLGALFAPIGTPSAKINQPEANNNFSFVQMANEEVNPKQGETCPMTGESMGKRAGMGMMGGMMGGMMNSMDEVISEELGMKVDEFQAARLEGKTVAEIAEEKGVTVKELVKVLIDSRKSELSQFVKEGKLTQEQLDNMLKNMETRMEQTLANDGIGPMQGRGMGMGMGHGGGCGNNTETQQTQTGTGTEL
jgi:hypothetical protein